MPNRRERRMIGSAPSRYGTISFSSSCRMSASAISMTSRTDPCGMANASAPTRPMSASVIASVTGSRIMKRVPCPGSAIERHRAGEFFDHRLDDRHADAAPARAIGFFLGGEARRAQQAEHGRGVERPGRHAQAGLPRLVDDSLLVHAVAIVRHFERHHVADGCRAERDRAFRALAVSDPHVGRLDAVADGVAHEVEHRVHHPLDQVLVDFCRLPAQLELDALSVFAREIAHDQRHPPEYFTDGNHAYPHDAFAQHAKLAVAGEGVFLHRSPFGRRARGAPLDSSCLPAAPG